MSTRRWILCLLFGPATLAVAQPVPAIIKDLNEISDGTGSDPGSTPGAPRRTASSLPNEIVRAGTNKVFFAATGDTYGRELWSYSSSSPPVIGEWKLPNGPVSSDPRILTPAGVNVYFVANVLEISGTTIVTRERVHFADGTSTPQLVTPTASPPLPPAYGVMDIAPVGTTATTAMLAIWDPSTSMTRFFRTSPLPAMTANWVADTPYRMVGDMLDCDYDGSDGFLAFTGMPNNSPVRRTLVALVGTTFNDIYDGEVDNLTADGNAVCFTAEEGGAYKLYRWTKGLPVLQPDEVHASLTPISNLMRAVISSENRIYYLIETSDGWHNVFRAFNGHTDWVEWPNGTSDVKVTASFVVGTLPHVLGTGEIDGIRYWAIWRTTPSGKDMELVKKLEGWSSCSQLVASASSDKLAFVGQYHPWSSDLRSTHLGFVVSSGGIWSVTAKPFTDLSEGSVPSSLVALDTRVVFSARHRLKGIEPWSCDFP